MNRKRIGKVSTRKLLIIGIPTLLIGLVVFGVAYYYVVPAPPRTLVMTTGIAHITIAEQLEGKAADWMEKVSTEQYNGK